VNFIDPSRIGEMSFSQIRYWIDRCVARGILTRR